MAVRFNNCLRFMRQKAVTIPRRKLIGKESSRFRKHLHQQPATEDQCQKVSAVKCVTTVSESASEFPYRQLFFSDSVRREVQFKHLLDCYMGIRHIQRMQPLTEEQLSLHRLELPTPNLGQKTLFLDLDETLIHTSLDPQVQFENSLQIKVEGLTAKEAPSTMEVSFRLRPHCLEFLRAVSQHYEVYIFTASNEDYARAVMQFLNQFYPAITGSLSRESCLKTSLGIYIKDIMRVVNRHPHQMLLVDNLAYSFGHMIDNGIPVVEFTGDQQDRQLQYLQEYLIECATQDDVRQFNRDRLRLRDIVVQLGSYFHKQ